MFRPIVLAVSLIAAPLLTMGAPAGAQQQSASYKFLEAVRSAKNDEVVSMLNQPGQTLVNSRDRSTGEGAVHIVVKRGDSAYLQFLLARGADANLKDGNGNTALLLAVQGGQGDLVDLLIAARANANLANASGETPLIRAVQKRDLNLVRTLLTAGGDPDQPDVLAGMSARDYAKADARSPAVAKLIEETPRKAKRAVAGPGLR